MGGFFPPEQRPQTSLEGVLSGTNCLRSEREFNFLPQAGVLAFSKGRLPAHMLCLGALHAGLPVSTMSSSQTVCGVGKWGGSAVSPSPGQPVCLYRFVCGFLACPPPRPTRNPRLPHPRPTTSPK